MSVLTIVFLCLGTISIALNLWQWVAGLRFPMRKTDQGVDFIPPVSVLKPLKGRDAETERCLESWFRQKYSGEIELLFAVACPNDPVCRVVQRLMEKHPDRRAELVIARPQRGPNGKVSSLCHLSARARHQVLVIADADVFVQDDYLFRVVREMREENVSLVNCFYILGQPQTVAMRIEAIAVNADFWTQVLQAIALRPMDFALGAVMAVRRVDLASVGGFEGLVELLADDYELGRRIAGLGRRIVICPTPVECRTEEQDAAAVWRHQMRWARTIRVSRPAGHFFSILSNGTLWPLLALLTGTPAGRWIFATGLLIRMFSAMANYRRLSGRLKWWVPLLAPVKDITQVLLWAVSFCGREITWHGQRFRVSRGGKLTPLA